MTTLVFPDELFTPRVRSFALHRQPTERPGRWLYYLYVVTNPSEVCDAYARGVSEGWMGPSHHDPQTAITEGYERWRSELNRLLAIRNGELTQLPRSPAPPRGGEPKPARGKAKPSATPPPDLTTLLKELGL